VVTKKKEKDMPTTDEHARQEQGGERRGVTFTLNPAAYRFSHDEQKAVQDLVTKVRDIVESCYPEASHLNTTNNLFKLVLQYNNVPRVDFNWLHNELRNRLDLFCQLYVAIEDNPMDGVVLTIEVHKEVTWKLSERYSLCQRLTFLFLVILALVAMFHPFLSHFSEKFSLP
jgi:hypothetical protein